MTQSFEKLDIPFFWVTRSWEDCPCNRWKVWTTGQVQIIHSLRFSKFSEFIQDKKSTRKMKHCRVKMNKFQHKSRMNSTWITLNQAFPMKKWMTKWIQWRNVGTATTAKPGAAKIWGAPNRPKMWDNWATSTEWLAKLPVLVNYLAFWEIFNDI